MADLSQFLNSGGKRYRLASSHSLYISSTSTLTESITPASDEFAVLIPHVKINTSFCTLTAGGRDITPSDSIYGWQGQAVTGLGEQISLTNKNSQSVALGVLIYEEDA